MERRDFLNLAAVTPFAASSLVNAAIASSESKIFILVHGTWLGGWIWQDVAQALRKMGHRVFTPTLTGVGERHHLTNPDIGLGTHINDIVGVIDYEELSDVILIGHSFSGMAITGAADVRKEKIRHIGFFEALIPHEGRMTAVEMNADGSETEKFRERRSRFLDGYQMVFWDDYPIEMLVGNEYPKVRAKLRKLLTPHPADAWTDKLILKNGGWRDLPRTYLRGTKQEFAPSSIKMWGPAKQPGWDWIDVPVGRMGMMTHPEIMASAFAKLS
ncbi:alpha/beta fold hydrolase [Sphingorhabdus sp. Alg231-15]|uniref:alpha/beta fold hydrolase n=1 Tax=Sphingorhabdus sp. Alg231-15 TaxID=1922222 RepID=UPI000D54C97E